MNASENQKVNQEWIFRKHREYRSQNMERKNPQTQLKDEQHGPLARKKETKIQNKIWEENRCSRRVSSVGKITARST